MSSMLDYSKSPRSVSAVITPTDLPPFPKLGGKNDFALRLRTHRQRLQKMNHVVSVWKRRTLELRKRSSNIKSKRHHVKKSVAFPQSTMKMTKVKDFDSASAVVTLTSAGYTTPQIRVCIETPWFEQEYQELPWWEYPDLDEDDEVTALCKRAMGDIQARDAAYVERVEALVWTAALRLKNLAHFMLNDKEREQTRGESQVQQQQQQPQKQASSRGKPHARVQIPSIFMGLPKEVQAEKRRYRKHQQQARSEDNKKTEVPSMPKKASPPLPVVTTPVGRTISRVSSSKKKTEVDTESPSAWTRSTTAASKDVARRPTPLSPRAAPSSETRENRIQKLKQKQRSMKQEQERLERERAERQEATKRMEAQKRRLERLRKSRGSSTSP